MPLAKECVIGTKYLSPKGYPFTVIEKLDNAIKVSHEVEGYGLQQTTMSNETEVLEFDPSKVVKQTPVKVTSTAKESRSVDKVVSVAESKPKRRKEKAVKDFGQVQPIKAIYTKRSYIPAKKGQAFYLSGDTYLLVDLSKHRVLNRTLKAKVIDKE